MTDIHVEAMHKAADLAKREAEAKASKMESELDGIREDARTLGVLQKINYDNAHNELIKYSMLYQIRKTKEYKKSGMTWDEYCEAAGENVRTVQRNFKRLKVIYETFHDRLSCFSEVPLSKIKYLGDALSEKNDTASQNEEAAPVKVEENHLIIDGSKVLLTPDNKDEIETAIDTLVESHKKEKKDLKKKLENQKKQADRAETEEIKGLKTEVDSLVKEVNRLKPYDVKERDRSWSIDQMQKVVTSMAGLSAACHPLILDDRMDGDRKLQAEVEKYITEAEGHLEDLRRLWIDRFVD